MSAYTPKVRRRLEAFYGIAPPPAARPTPYAWTCADSMETDACSAEAHGCGIVHRSRSAAERCAAGWYDFRVVEISAEDARRLRARRKANTNG